MGSEVRFTPPRDNFFMLLDLWECFPELRVHGPLLNLSGIRYSKENCRWKWMFPIWIFSLACIPWVSFVANLPAPSQVYFNGLHLSHMGFRGLFWKDILPVFPGVPTGRGQAPREVWAVNGSWHKLSSPCKCLLCDESAPLVWIMY